MIYYLLVMVLCLFSFINQLKPVKANLDILKFIAFILILFIGGLRFEVGADWLSYEKLFNRVATFYDIFSSREEKLFMFFQYVCKTIFNSYSFFVFSLFAFTFYLKYKILVRYSTDIFLSLIVYIYTLFLIYDLNGLRQGMAIAILLASIPAILNKRKYLFLILISVASLCHTSAIVFFPFYWLARIKIAPSKILMSTFVCLLISTLIKEIILNSSLFQFLLLMDNFSHYSYYLDSEAANKEISVFSVSVFQRFLVFIIFIINYNKLKCDEVLKRFLLNGYFIAIVIFVFLSFNSEYAARLSFYYKSLELFMIPIIVSSQKKLESKIIMWGLFVVLCLLGMYRLLEVPDAGLLPYKSILFYF